MATINEHTLTHAKVTLFYRINQHNVPVPLPFMLMTIDNDDQYYVPTSMGGPMNDQCERSQAAATEVVYLDRNQWLPVGTIGAWEYHGV